MKHLGVQIPQAVIIVFLAVMTGPRSGWRSP